jgi:hypothetical protein
MTRQLLEIADREKYPYTIADFPFNSSSVYAALYRAKGVMDHESVKARIENGRGGWKTARVFTQTAMDVISDMLTNRSRTGPRMKDPVYQYAKKAAQRRDESLQLYLLIVVGLVDRGGGF